MLTKGLLEPTRPIPAKLDAYEKITTIGQDFMNSALKAQKYF